MDGELCAKNLKKYLPKEQNHQPITEALPPRIQKNMKKLQPFQSDTPAKNQGGGKSGQWFYIIIGQLLLILN